MVLVRPDAIRCWLLRAGDSWLSAARGFARYASLSSVVEMGRRVEMGKRRGGTRKACVLVAVMACVLAVVGLGLIATGHLCITSARRPADRYGQDCCSGGGGAAGIALSGAVDSPDVDFDGIPDDEDILAAALSYIGTRPHYKSAYYASGYPDDEFGVCTDVVAIACRDAGYDLQRLVAADIVHRPDAYGIAAPDPAIDFRRTPNLEVFLGAHALSLTNDVREIDQWCGGDIVLYEGHVGIVSDRRNVQGIPYLIHHASPFQLCYEEDGLERYGRIIGHYRMKPACLDLLERA